MTARRTITPDGSVSARPPATGDRDGWTGRTRVARPNRRAVAEAATADGLDRAQKLELYYYMRLTRTLEERLVNLYRQTKVVGGLFRSLGQEADAVGSAYALDRSARRHALPADPQSGVDARARGASGGDHPAVHGQGRLAHAWT